MGLRSAPGRSRQPSLRRKAGALERARILGHNEPKDNPAFEGATSGGGVAGGPDGYEGHVTFYVAVDDIEASLQKAESLGGTRVMGPEKIMDMVELGQFKDPEGHVIGVVKGM